MLYNKSILILVLLISSFSLSSKSQAEEIKFAKNLKINSFTPVKKLSSLQDVQYKKLFNALSDDSSNNPEFYHVIKEISASQIILEDGSSWRIGWWYKNDSKNWQPGNRLKISYHSTYSNYICFENIDMPGNSWGVLEKIPDSNLTHKIRSIANKKKDVEVKQETLKLNTGINFATTSEKYPYDWSISDFIFIFHNADKANYYDLWNMKKGEISWGWTISSEVYLKERFKKKVLQLEDNLNKRILAQPEATKAVTTAILNYCADMKDPNQPISVFLFLGPTGVGKTELAKVLTDELYQNADHLIRLDMSHFTESYTMTRLIGSPPGYVNHEEGGQLTEAIKLQPQSIVLLDEFEKAHTTIKKAFLTIFDEGFVIDSKNQKIDCRDVIFIITSNQCAFEIIKGFNEGLSGDEVLDTIEFDLQLAFSPELYNRVEPVVFHPLEKETMSDLVNLMMIDLVKRVKANKEINLIIDDSVKEYLIENGFHPILGARPLKRLIQKELVSALSFSLISENIPRNSDIVIWYNTSDDSWNVEWIRE